MLPQEEFVKVTPTGRRMPWVRRSCCFCARRYEVPRHAPRMTCGPCRGWILLQGPSGGIEFMDLQQAEELLGQLRDLGFVEEWLEVEEDGRKVFRLK